MIRSARAFHIGGPTPPEVASARGSFPARRGVLIELGDERGVAYGEASPLPGFSRESLDEVVERVVAFPWASLEVPRGLTDLGSLSIAEPSLSFAIEHALLSLLARRIHSTLPELLAGGAPSSLGTSVLVGGVGSGDLLARATDALSRGAVSLKVKVGAGEIVSHRERIAEIRRQAGASVEIRLDFNGTLARFSREEIVDALERLEPLDIAFVEEPWGGPRLLALGDLPIPWFADESLADPSARDALLGCESAGGYVLKPSLLGLLGAWNLAVRASTHQRGVVVSHLFEGGVAMAAAADLALACHGLATARAPGLDRHAALASFDLPLPPQLGERAVVERAAPDALDAFTAALGQRVARERPFFEWTR